MQVIFKDLILHWALFDAGFDDVIPSKEWYDGPIADFKLHKKSMDLEKGEEFRISYESHDNWSPREKEICIIHRGYHDHGWSIISIVVDIYDPECFDKMLSFIHRTEKEHERNKKRRSMV